MKQDFCNPVNPDCQSKKSGKLDSQISCVIANSRSKAMACVKLERTSDVHALATGFQEDTIQHWSEWQKGAIR